MKNDRVGEWLWEEWDGNGNVDGSSDLLDTVYCTYDWVEVDDSLVKRALASCLQRDGIVDSLSDGFRVAESASVIKTYVGCIDEEKVPTLCKENGETFLGDVVTSITRITLVQF